MKRQPAHAQFARIVVSASSAGGVAALRAILAQLPADFPSPIVIVQHRGVSPPYFLPQVLQTVTKLRVVPAHAGERLARGHVYVATPQQHLVIRGDHTLGYVDGRKIHHLRSSADPLFESASEIYGPGVVALVLTGYDRDATAGAQTIKNRGGIVIAQDPEDCEVPEMPRSAIHGGAIDVVLPVEKIPSALLRLVSAPLRLDRGCESRVPTARPRRPPSSRPARRWRAIGRG